jgi:hypothetical protein
MTPLLPISRMAKDVIMREMAPKETGVGLSERLRNIAPRPWQSGQSSFM